MKIAILNSKNPLDVVEKFKTKWPMYQFDNESFNKEFNTGDLEKDLYEELYFRRTEILDNYKNENQLFVTSPLETLVRILHNVELKNISDSSFIAESILFAQSNLKLYDVVFWIDDSTSEHKLIYTAIQDDYTSRSNVIFPEKDVPAYIRLTAGGADYIIMQIAQFLDENGKSYEPDDDFWSEGLEKELEAFKQLYS